MTFHRTKTCEVAEVFVDNFDRQQELGRWWQFTTVASWCSRR